MIELLEARRLMAVVVTEGLPGFYEITGDAADNVVAISVDKSARTFTLGGVVYGGVAYINVYGNGGNDSITLVGSGSGPVAASLKGGAGNDLLVLDHVDGAIWGGDGDDQMYFTDSFRAQAYGEVGNDHIVINGACVDAEIRGGDGEDTLDATGSSVGVFLYGEGNRDRLFGSPLDDLLDGGPGRDFFFGRGGDDMFYARDGEPDYLIGGPGNDTAICDAFEMNTSSTEFLITD